TLQPDTARLPVQSVPVTIRQRHAGPRSDIARPNELSEKVLNEEDSYHLGASQRHCFSSLRMPLLRIFCELFVVQADRAYGRSRYSHCSCSFYGPAWWCARWRTARNTVDHCYADQFCFIRWIGRSRASCMDNLEQKQGQVNLR